MIAIGSIKNFDAVTFGEKVLTLAKSRGALKLLGYVRLTDMGVKKYLSGEKIHSFAPSFNPNFCVKGSLNRGTN